MSVRLTIFSEIEAVAAEQQKQLTPLTDDLLLVDSGLDSLCLAIIVARLEDKFGVDPFASISASRFPTTIGSLVFIYEGAEA